MEYVQRKLLAPPALSSVHSLIQKRHFSLFFLFSLVFPRSCLGGWYSREEPECKRGPQRADEDCLTKPVSSLGLFPLCLCGCVSIYVYVCEAGISLNVRFHVCVRLVLVSTPHSLIKRREKPLTRRLNFKG